MTPSIPVAIVGAGPVGLALAVGLSRHGVDSVVLERAATTSRHSKAAVIHVRTREALRQWGIEQPFLEAGTLRSSITLHAAADDRPRVTLDLAELSTEVEDPGLLLLEQSVTEQLLLDELRSGGLGQVRFATEVIGCTQHATGVTVTARTEQGEQQFDARFVVGCDGASSSVRRLMGLPFRGLTYRVCPMLADVHIDDARDARPWPRQHQGSDGVTNAVRLRPGLWRIIRLDDRAPTGDAVHTGAPVDDTEVARRVEEVLGPGPFEVVWAQRFRIHRRSSPRFRLGRIVLAGDAAHVHSPLGGLGMNAGVQDAHNLAWKLASALSGGDIDRLLGSYDIERRAVVVEQVSRTTDIATRLFLQSPPAVRDRSVDAAGLVTGFGPLRRRGLRALAMIDLAYPGSPLLDADLHSAGTRLPDPLLVDPHGQDVRLHRLLPTAAPMLIEVASAGSRPDRSEETDPSAHPAARGMATLRVGSGGHQDPQGVLRELLGDRNGWMLVRPDGHLAWTGPDRPAAEAVNRALGLPTGAGTGQEPEPSGYAATPRSRIRTTIRRLRDRTTLDMPHHR